MTAIDLIESWIARLEAERQRVGEAGYDVPIAAVEGRLVRTSGALHLYEFTVPPGVSLAVDVPVSIVPSDEMDATEGVVLRQAGNSLLVQVIDALGEVVPSVTLIPDLAGLLATSVNRLKEIITRADAYTLGPAERLASLMQTPEDVRKGASSGSTVLTT